MTNALYWIPLTHQQPAPGLFVSLDDLIVLALVPLLGGGLVLYIMEDILGAPEHKSFGVTGLLLVVVALIWGPSFDPGVALALRREFGWRIGFQVKRPLTFYWGLWGVLMLLSAYDELQTDEGKETTS